MKFYHSEAREQSLNRGTGSDFPCAVTWVGESGDGPFEQIKQEAAE